MLATQVYGSLARWLVFKMYTRVKIGEGVDDFETYIFVYSIVTVVEQSVIMTAFLVTVALFFYKTCKRH